jgi:hypothetical protein
MQRTIKSVGLGAGPANLFMYIQAKLYNPELEVVIYERYEEYKRSHLLIINPKSFKGMHPDKRFQAMIKSFGEKIRTNDLEGKLKEFALNLGIKIIYEKVEDCEKIAAKHPDATTMVSACGARGLARQQLFNDELRDKKNLQHIAEIKYSVTGRTKPLNALMQAIPASCHVNHFTIEHIGSEHEGTTPITIRFFISPEEYAQMEKARGATFFTLKSNDISPLLKASIENWLLLRGSMAKEVRLENSERITVTNLGIYASKAFVKTQFSDTPHAKKVVLMGDEAFGVPYFRSMNNAILCSSVLAKAIAVDGPLDEYVKFVDMLATSEIKAARNKAKGLHVLEIGRDLMSGKLPLIGTTRVSLASVSLFTPTIRMKDKQVMQARNKAALAVIVADKDSEEALEHSPRMK